MRRALYLSAAAAFVAIASASVWTHVSDDGSPSKEASFAVISANAPSWAARTQGAGAVRNTMPSAGDVPKRQTSVAATVKAAAVKITNGMLTRGDLPWIPRGVVQIAFVAPPSAQAGVFFDAYQNYTPTDYASMHDLGIDSVRIQVSQPGLDPQSALFDPVFRDRFFDAVRAARAHGLSVLISIQDEEQSGEPAPTDLPNAGTRRVWATIAPQFGDDRGVFFELLNEPRPDATTANWAAWRDAHNLTIQTIRNAGAVNVVVADGLLSGERLSGAPALTDPLNQVAYASHPYAHNAQGQTAADWDTKFGNFAQTHPVIVTEWTTSTNFYCDSNSPLSATNFLSYLGNHRVGLMAFAWDFSGIKFGSAFQGFPPQPTTYANLNCGDVGFGPGKKILNAYSIWPQ